MKKEGFSLIELLVTVGILGILFLIAIPSYRSYIHSTKARAVTAIIKEIETAFQACYREREFSPYYEKGNPLPVNPKDCFDKPIKGHFTIPTENIDSIIHNKDSKSEKGCWSVKYKDAVNDKKMIQCVDFNLKTKKGMKNHETKDDGTNQGTCQNGVCQ